MISNNQAAEDIIQNIFLRLYENMQNIRNRDSIQYWLFRSAKNEVYAWFRSRKVRKDQFDVEDVNELEIMAPSELNEIVEIEEARQILLSELDRLPQEQKEIFILKEYSGLSYSEIASLLEIDEGLVKSRLYKTRIKLINAMKKIYR